MSPPRSRSIHTWRLPAAWVVSLTVPGAGASWSAPYQLVTLPAHKRPVPRASPRPPRRPRSTGTPSTTWYAPARPPRPSRTSRPFSRATHPTKMLVKIRDSYGAGSFLRLDDDPATRPYADALLTLMAAASQRQAQDPARLEQFANGLLGTAAEQQYAIEELRKAGADAVPALVEKLQQPGLDAVDKASLVDGMSRLRALGRARLWSPRLTRPTPTSRPTPPRRSAASATPGLCPSWPTRPARPMTPCCEQPARQAIERITGRSFAGQTRSPVATLLDEAQPLPDPQGQSRRRPCSALDLARPRSPSANDIPPARPRASSASGFAQQALELDPENREAQTLLVALAIQKEVEKHRNRPLSLEPVQWRVSARTPASP